MQCISKFYAETCWHTIFLQLYIQRSFLNLKVLLQSFPKLDFCFLYGSRNSRSNLCAYNIRVTIAIMFAKFKDGCTKLYDCMWNVRPFQFYISFFMFIGRAKHVVTLCTLM